jgi:hypothetical protein
MSSGTITFEVYSMRYAAAIVFLTMSLATVQAGPVDVVVPNANAAANGNAPQFLIIGNGAAGTYTFQWELAASQLTALTGDSLTAIGFRLGADAASVAAGTTIPSFNLELSPSVNPIGSLSTTIANNIGAGGVTVYSGSVVLGALTGGAGPNPFFLISFSTPYTYTGGDLVVTEIVTTSADLAVDANNVGDGLVDTVSDIGGSGLAEFFNYPITEFEGTAGTADAAPEPATLFGLAGGMLFFGALRLRRARRS